MNRRLAVSLLLLAPTLTAAAVAQQFIPAGSLIQCTLDDKVSSKTVAVGDPVLCEVSHTELYGRSTVPFGSYLVGRFADYKDPGHFVGKGWVELKFDRLVLGADTTIPVNARVVSVPKYPVDEQGKILGTGHATRDIVEWSIPVLWPIDLVNLPRRGPRVVLKPETTLTLRVMEDLGLPQSVDGSNTPRRPLIAQNQPAQNQPAQNQSQYQQQPAPVVQAYAAPPPPSYQQAPQTVIYNNYPQQSNNYPQYQAPPQQQQTVIVQQQQPAPRYVPRPVVVAPYPYGYVPYGYAPRYYGPY